MIIRFRADNPLGYPDLSKGQLYCVIGIEADHFRLLNDAGKPYLYPSEEFDIVDSREPQDWINQFGADGARYSYPESLNRVGFFEDFFDGKHQQVSTFWGIVNRNLAGAA
uniref:Uncharacterized protein n=1 Tax=Candidatus Kentrum sp. LPFa TaxID=2126335 RepID=A0A450XT66_9GAMM|nr:MAG: hypothetical protein BECKLPF1236A_GA0070988_101854 [Candidatus Kentron sp. LPFa]VFK32480.1 MAG: hypothetical protein BECKLPF1236C_GA0070990_101684 [Candidatus Kentron sp. LPFa]